MSHTESDEPRPQRPPEHHTPTPLRQPGEAPKDRPDPAGGGAMPDNPQGDEVDPGLG